ncbi:MAG: hypothetical protein AAFR58_11040 [Cyanobacteria bacterium J06627_28]
MSQTVQAEKTIEAVEIPKQQKKKLRFNSFGIRLFSLIMGGAIVSIAGVAFLFSEVIKNQAEDQIQITLESKVARIHEVTDRAETLAYSLGVSVGTLHIRGAETTGTYQELTRQLFDEHPDYILGLGFGQKQNGVLPNEDWFYPFYEADSVVGEAALPTTESAKSSRYVDRASADNFYPETEAYQRYFLPQQRVWTAPYADVRSTLLTHYSPIVTDSGEWLGTAVIDVDGDYLSEMLDRPVFQNGGQLMLLSTDGNVIANPAAANDNVAVEGQTFTDIPGLSEIWPQISAEATSSTETTGLIEGETGYWSYVRLPEQSWLVLAYVPYRTVFGQIATIALSTVLLAGLLMLILVAIAVRYLNRRLRPVINECQRLSIEDDSVTEKMANQDELSQLSTSFFNLLEQLQLSQTQVKLEAAHATEVEEKLSQIQARSSASQLRKQRVSRQLEALLPANKPKDSNTSRVNSPSMQRLQQELTQLTQAVSMLAEDDWLFGAIAPEYLNELSDELNRNQLSQNLSQTFVQVVAALTHFSQLLSAYYRTNEHVQGIEQDMLTASNELRSQKDLLAKLQQWSRAHGDLFAGLTQQISLIDRQATDTESTIRQREAAQIADAVAGFKGTAQQLQQQMRSLFSATEDINRRAKQYQRITSTAQVLIMNATTLSISASRRLEPADYENLVTQFRSKESELKKLTQQLEDAKEQHYQSSEQVDALVSTLRQNMNTFDQSVRQLDNVLGSSVQLQRQDQTAAKEIHHASQRASTMQQQLFDQLQTLQQLIEETASLTTATETQISRTLQQTRQVSDIRADVPLALPKAKD